MAKTVLIAGKEMPAGNKFADGMAITNRRISISGPETDVSDTDKRRQLSEASGISVVEWNKISPISARTIILHTENIFGKMDEAVLYFDEEWFASLEQQISNQECIRGCDELIMPFQCLALEVLSRFEKKNASGEPGILVFLIKQAPNIADTILSPAVRNGVSSIASPVVAAAASAFMSFAQNIAALYGNQNYVNILLMNSGLGNETSVSDVEFGKWVGTYLDAFEDSGATLDAKKSITWIKAGTKYGAGGFSLFGKRGR